MAQTPIQRLIKRLKRYCDEGRGRRVEVAKVLDVYPQTLTKWFTGKGEPTGSQTLAILDFLKNKKERKNR